MNRTTACILAALGLAATAGPALADCASDAAVAAYVEDWRAGRPAKALAAGGSMEDALCTQGKLIVALAASHGPVIGYKAGLTSKAAQEKFGVDAPVRGTLLERMMLASGTTVSPDFGARPLFEADLLLVVGSAGINTATTREEALEHISLVVPFIELPDLALAEGEPITGVTLTAGNVGARLGVVGPEIEMTPGMGAALAAMTVRVTDAEGSVLAETKGSAVLGHPVESVLWLVRDGVELAPGDIVSVGSIGPLFPPAKAKGMATVTYEGLPGDPEVSVRFE